MACAEISDEPGKEQHMREYVITDFVYDGTPVRAAALFENGRMEELRAERRDETSLVGRVYRGVVDSVNRNIGGAFIDIGSGGRGAGENAQHRDGLVYMSVPRVLKRPEGSKEKKDRPHDMADIRPTLPVLVQITKDAVGPKQPVATENITLAGRYLVLTRFGGRMSFSQKLTDEQKDIIRTWIPKSERQGFHVLVRTNAGHADKGTVLAELARLRERMHLILEGGEDARTGTCLYEPEPLYESMYRDFRETPDRVLTDIPLAADILEREDIREPGEHAEPAMQGASVRQREGSGSREISRPEIVVTRLVNGLPLAEGFHLQENFDKLTQRIVWLKSGAFLVIEQTEAFVVIDVNTGRSSKGRIPEETYRRVNIEAAPEICRQIRLRNLSGEILVDFIKMKSADHRDELLHVMRKAVRRDHVRTEVVDLTGLGILEMTRQKTSRPLADILEK